MSTYRGKVNEERSAWSVREGELGAFGISISFSGFHAEMRAAIWAQRDVKSITNCQTRA